LITAIEDVCWQFLTYNPEHEESGKAPPLEPIPEEEQTKFQPLMVIKSGVDKPERYFVSVRYDGVWFWIDESDYLSNTTATFGLDFQNNIC